MWFMGVLMGRGDWVSDAHSYTYLHQSIQSIRTAADGTRQPDIDWESAKSGDGEWHSHD